MPVKVYFDLDNNQVLTLSEEEAAANSDWDIALRRTKVYLNSSAAVKAYATGNNADFFDAEGEPVVSQFVNATAEGELSDFIAVEAAAIPAASEFTTDASELIIGDKFYHYDVSTHVVSAADERYFVVYSDGNYSKIRAKTLTTAGRVLATITLGVAQQLSPATSFGDEVEMVVNASGCSGDKIYIDLDGRTQVTADDAWDIYLPCVTLSGNTGAGYEMHIAADATAIADNNYAGIDTSAHNFYGFVADETQVLFFDSNPWYQYNLEGTHLLYSQYQVYLIKTASAIYKLQITSYYNTNGVSGNYSFRYQFLQ